jgi:hypothetical protein
MADLQDRGTELLGEVVCCEDRNKLRYVRGPEGIIVELVLRIDSRLRGSGSEAAPIVPLRKS